MQKQDTLEHDSAPLWIYLTHCKGFGFKNIILGTMYNNTKNTVKVITQSVYHSNFCPAHLWAERKLMSEYYQQLFN